MPVPSSFDYAVIRVVPFVERKEFVNAGVILFCRTCQFLGTKTLLEASRFRALYPRLDLTAVAAHLSIFEQICRDNAPPPFTDYSLAEKFHWLVSPKSTMIQVSAVHSGICKDPAETLEMLMDTLVRMPPTLPAP